MLNKYFLKLYNYIKIQKHQEISTIIYPNSKQFAKLFTSTAVAGIISKSAPETTAGIQATLGKNISVLKHLQPDGDFSIRQ